MVTSSPDTYRSVLPHLGPRPGGPDCGAEILGAHLEGPFISRSVSCETCQLVNFITIVDKKYRYRLPKLSNQDLKLMGYIN